jgi:hypothetical protein
MKITFAKLINKIETVYILGIFLCEYRNYGGTRGLVVTIIGE